MLERQAILRDRMKALGVFSGIAIAAVAGFELVISAGLDPLTPRALAEAPSEYDEQTVMQAWHHQPYAPTAYVTETDQYLGHPIDEAVVDQLAGGPDDPTAPEAPVLEDAGAYDDGGLYEEIVRLYTRSVEAPTAEDAKPPAWPEEESVESLPFEEDVLEDEAEHLPTSEPPPDDKATTYESASPS